MSSIATIPLPPPHDLRPLFLLGPTGSGKSDAALAIAERLNGRAEIISADAYQIYRGMEVLTAAPPAADRARIPHHLIASLEPTEPNDAATHARRAQSCIATVQARGKVPIVTGGSGLYVKFISHGISPAPPSDPTLRAELEALPLEEVARRLQTADPAGAAVTDLQNPRYVRRNLEIVLAGGKPLAYWRDNWREPTGLGYVILPEIAELDNRIARRAQSMLRNGAIDEVAALDAAGVPLSATAEKTLGLALIREHLAGRMGHSELEAALTLATRQYAKRQRTWLRRERWLVTLN